MMRYQVLNHLLTATKTFEVLGNLVWKKLRKNITAQKMKFSIKDFFSKCDQIRRKLQILSHLLKNLLMENFIFCAVHVSSL